MSMTSRTKKLIGAALAIAAIVTSFVACSAAREDVDSSESALDPHPSVTLIRSSRAHLK